MNENLIKTFSIFLVLLFLIPLLVGCASNTNSTIPDSEEEIIIEENLQKVEAKPEDGFYWDYYLYTPNMKITQSTTEPIKHLIVEPNNTGKTTDDINVHEEAAKQRAQDHFIGEKLKSPVLVPVISRPDTIQKAPEEGWRYYTHSLDRNTMQLEVEKYKRLDKQLLAMIEDAKSRLKQNHIEVQNEVLMFGFSASGSFVNRFTAMHPEKVQAIAAGGLNGMAILPHEKLNDRNLYYPVGVYDVNKLTNKDFNLEAFKNVPQLLIMGSEDSNDTLPNDDAFNDRQKDIIKDVYNTKPANNDANILIERFKKAKEFYQQKNIQSQFAIYEGVGHTITTEMGKDIVEFFQKNSKDDDIDKITIQN